MKKQFCYNFIIALTLVWFIPLTSIAQKNYAFKFGISKAFNKQYFIANQVKVLKSFSINLETGVLKKAHYMETADVQTVKGAYTTDQTRDTDRSFRLRTNAEIGYQVNLEARFHPSKEINEGLYIGIKSGYQYVDFGNLMVTWNSNNVLFNSPSYTKAITASQQSWMMGGSIGCSIKFSKNLFLDLNLFSGYKYIIAVAPGVNPTW